ncbi:MAG: TetR/AcrR family transcriptional regulator [Candidatus Limnocylindrales bacterium]|jgi:AcrR family transcriptional regulator
MGDVKERPTLRDERAGVTRRRIADAARTLFRTRGYGASTLQAVAQEAGVAVQTVYAVYGSKAGILHELRDTVLRQPAAEALYEDAMREPRAERKLELFARSIRRRWEFGHDVVAIHRDAGATDPSVRAEVEQVLDMRRNGIARLARSLETELTPGIDVAYATAVLDALTLPEVYAELTDSQGWSAEQFEAWLARCLKNQLLGIRPRAVRT